jgi:putative PEP-CTERM system histidine kinase
LKNIVAQLSLVVNNATKHKHNPVFVDDALCTVDNATQKMIKLLNQLRKGRLNIAPRQEPINVIRLIEEAIERRSIDMPIPKLFCHEDEVMARGDYDRLLSVLEHLIQNAQDATSTEGYIHIRCSQDYEKQAKIEIEDNGCGMDEAFLRERLFKPFQTTKGNAGMGIGVYESREYVVAMGGALSVKSELDKGTIFTIHLSLSGNAIKNKPLDRSVGISG